VTQPPNYGRQERVSPIGDGPAELEHKRWVWLQYQAIPLIGRALDDIVGRLDRIEQKLEMLMGATPAPEPPARRRRKVASEDANLEQ